MIRNIRLPAVICVTVCLTALAVWAVSEPGVDSIRFQIVAGAVTFLICSWAFRMIQEGAAALFFFLVLSASGSLPPNAVFSGFTTPAFWLVFSGLIIGAAIRQSGLSRRLASLFRPGVGSAYKGILLRIIGASIVFSFVVPSAMGRVLILLPVLQDVAEACGFSKEDRGYVGFLLAGVMGTYIPAFTILPANLPNIVLAGASESIYGVTMGYMQYLVLHFPVLGIGKALVLWGVLRALFPDTVLVGETVETKEPWQSQEKYTLCILLSALVLWMLDSLHGVSPGWVSLGAAIALLIPLPRLAQNRKMDLLGNVKVETLLFVACAIGLGNVVTVSGLGSYVTGELLKLLPLSAQGGVENCFMSLGLFMTTGLMTSLPGIPSVFVPLSGDIARAADVPLLTMLMVQVLAFSTILLPYQAPPLVVAAQTGGLSYRSVASACLMLAVVTFLVLFPLDILWWQLVGLPLQAG